MYMCVPACQNSCMQVAASVGHVMGDLFEECMQVVRVSSEVQYTLARKYWLLTISALLVARPAVGSDLMRPATHRRFARVRLVAGGWSFLGSISVRSSPFRFYYRGRRLA